MHLASYILFYDICLALKGSHSSFYCKFYCLFSNYPNKKTIAGGGQGGGEARGGSAPPMSWRTTPVKGWNPRRNWEGRRWLCVIIKSRIFFCKISPEKCRKTHLRYSGFQNFPGEHAPAPRRMARAFGARILLPPPKLLPWLRYWASHVLKK